MFSDKNAPENQKQTGPDSPAAADKPFYVVGDTALAYYLSAKLTDAGRRVIAISDKASNTSLSTNGFILKEDRSLKNARYRLTTSFWMKEKAELVLLCASASKLNAFLSSLSRPKIDAAPVLCFSAHKDIEYIEGILGPNVCAAYFDGFLKLEGQQLLLFGRSPSITVCKNRTWKENNPFPGLFAGTDINLCFEDNENAGFWNFFAPYAVGSLITAVGGKNIFDITKDKQLREELSPLIAEMAGLAAVDGIKLDEENVLKKLYNIPMNYVYPLQQEIKNGGRGEIGVISSVITNASRAAKTRVPAAKLNGLLKKLYDLTLA